MTSKPTATIGESVSQALIVACNEEIRPLRAALAAQGFAVEVIRRNYSPDELLMPRAMRALLNHSQAWQQVVDSEQPALVVEADFVPCQQLGSLAMPYASQVAEPKLAFLYAAGPVIYHADQHGGYYGHACATVAYLLEPEAARRWLDLLAEHRQQRGFYLYYPWEVEMFVDLRHRKGVRLYLTEKSYGEHGGEPNPEHNHQGFRGWHQADALAAPLEFLPSYARGSQVRYVLIRARSRLRYAYKFARGKYFDAWSNFLSLRPNRRGKLAFAFRRAFF